MKHLLILGAGGHGRVVADAATQMGIWETIAFLDDNISHSPGNFWPILGTLKQFLEFHSRFTHFVVGIGNNHLRHRLLEQCLESDLILASILHPSAVISPSVQIGAGTVVFANAVINQGSVIGRASIINTAATIDHDCWLDDCVHVSPGVHVGGEVKVGKLTWLGIGATVRNQIKIGQEVMVGAGAVVVNDIASGSTSVGVPARPVQVSTQSSSAKHEHCSMLPNWPFYAADEIAAVTRVLQSGEVNYWTGNIGRDFEKRYAEYFGCRHAIALANGTVGLELALRVLGIGEGDEVIVPCRTFIATASAVVMCGAKPVLVDVGLESQNILVDAIHAAITPNTKAIIAVHLAGWPCDMQAILAIAETHQLKVIEDCAQAHGACYRGQPVGTFGDIGIFSFCQDKIISTGGEGGMLITNDSALWEKAWAFKDHGKSFQAVYAQDHPPGYRWIHHSFGTNWRMTEMQAAIGLLQLGKLAYWVERRRENASILTEELALLPSLRLTIPPPEYFHAYYKYYCFLKLEHLKPGWDRDKLLQLLLDAKLPVSTGICGELYRERAFIEYAESLSKPLVNASRLNLTSLVLPTHPTLNVQHMKYLARAFVEIVQSVTA